MQQSWRENLLELETQLARSKAPWKLVIGHHPVRRNNRPDNNMDLLPTLEPILEKYGVQAYFCGHEHNLQYIHQPNSSVHYVITGGGSLTDYTPIVHYDNGGSQFQYWGSGEMRPDFTAQQLCKVSQIVHMCCWMVTDCLSSLYARAYCVFESLQILQMGIQLNACSMQLQILQVCHDGACFLYWPCHKLMSAVGLQALSPVCWKAQACAVISSASRKADRCTAFRCIANQRLQLQH